MAWVQSDTVNGKEYFTLCDNVAGRKIRYRINVKHYSKAKWERAHDAVLSCLDVATLGTVDAKGIKIRVQDFLDSPVDVQQQVKDSRRISTRAYAPPSPGAITWEALMGSYLEEFTATSGTCPLWQQAVKKQVETVLAFLSSRGVRTYDQLTRETAREYPAWRGSFRWPTDTRDKEKAVSAEIIKKELIRWACAIRYGVRHYGIQERYTLEGVQAKRTTENTKLVTPFTIQECQAILKNLSERAENEKSWYTHDTVLLALLTGMENKAISNMTREWWLLDLGLLRIYDKAVSGVIDAKTQSRGREVPICHTMREIYQRGHIFTRPGIRGRLGAVPSTAARFMEHALSQAETATGIKDVNLHRFRHTFATQRLSSGWEMARVSKMLGHASISTTSNVYAKYAYSETDQGFEGMVKAHAQTVKWLEVDYFGTSPQLLSKGPTASNI